MLHADTVESHPSENEGWATGIESQQIEIVAISAVIGFLAGNFKGSCFAISSQSGT